MVESFSAGADIDWGRFWRFASTPAVCHPEASLVVGSVAVAVAVVVVALVVVAAAAGVCTWGAATGVVVVALC